MKISVVVATYNSPPELDGLVASLDAQTMEATEFEAIFVDDGSTDDTFARLQSLARERSYMVLDRIPNSGWPGRPRNVGIKQVKGDYVFFADHDDYFFPQALERMYQAATAARADILHPKEVVKGWSTPGWRSWPRSMDRVELDQATLQCISPHKLYRRSFLLAEDVWFPEGRVRLEDFSFNAKAWTRTDAIAMLADYPCYRWVVHEGSSHKNAYDFDIYWDSFVESLQPILQHPSGEKRDQLLVRWYRSRILERLGRPFAQYSDEHRERLLQQFATMLSYFPDNLDRYLSAADRARSALLRRGDEEGLLQLSRLDAGLVLTTRKLRMKWVEGQLRVSLDMLIEDEDGNPLAVQHDAGRVRRSVPESLRAALPADVWDLTADLEEAGGEIVIRSMGEKVDWIMPTDSTVEIVPAGDANTVRISLTATIDPRTSAGGAPLDADVWEVFCRVVGLGYTGTHRIRARKRHRSGALVDGAYVTTVLSSSRFLQLDLTGLRRNILDLVAGDPTICHGLRRSWIDVPGLHVAGETRLEGSVRLGGRSIPASLVGRDGRARVEVASLMRGEGDVTATFLERESEPFLTLGASEQPPAFVPRALIAGRARSRRLARRLTSRRGSTRS